jgi:hypothetical protein
MCCHIFYLVEDGLKELKHQYSETNMMHFLFILLRIKLAAPGLQFHSSPGAAN